ncbi:phenazine biosynthesis protein PhzC/PhzF [Bordetella genomosp. 1]|uniref:Phenazine biosynthesis protein PhzC/PhzF n=1 Tax=Bordetella genomosp. 1 TaxID=1395607 RepID=A0A261SPQ5_9BORD|nr:PhzF family phenazine biosynthesis protein [Bordetella genomosp. 1]MDQ8034727.1 PhzF family phenazine biosynthesis protein [Bordetella sp.]OZI39366.1 phenazine biosynthesis protein PhzC/PhzF [Bordetella genomosp. 1]
MKTYRYRLLNVFAESTFGGNPLCVFEDARGMDDATMQALALQFNLSETTFVLPAEDGADARVRIFTPGYEMRFAGHPTLGTAHVVRALLNRGDAVKLSFPAGIVDVQAQGDTWTLTAPTQGAPRTAAAKLAPAVIASHLGLREDDLLDAPSWVDTGADQLLVPVRSLDAVLRAQPDSGRLEEWELSSLGRRTAYVFAFDDATAGAGAGARRAVTARYFFAKAGGGVAEDPGTGSACANLGGWLIARGESPAQVRVSQGDQVQRPCRLLLDVSADGAIRVGGRVIELGQGEVRLP